MKQLITPIAHVKGDVTRPLGTGNKFIGNICNIAGIWTGRFMKMLADKWPETIADFKRWKVCTHPFIFGNRKPWPVLYGGSVDYTGVNTDTFVTHMAVIDVPVPETPFKDKSYEYFEECLDKIGLKALMCKASFHIQKSLAGFGPSVTWEGIEELIVKYFCNRGIRVIVYSDPAYLEDPTYDLGFTAPEDSLGDLQKLPSLSDAIATPPRMITKINYMIGDATSPSGDGSKIIAHICRSDGRWISDFGKMLDTKWPEAKEEYKKWYSDPRRPKGLCWLPKEISEVVFKMGNVQMVEVEAEIYVANMIAHWGKNSEDAPQPLSYHSLSACLEIVAVHAKERKATVHIPRHEEKLAGYNWDSYKKLIKEYLCNCGIEVFVYTSPEKLEIHSRTGGL